MKNKKNLFILLPVVLLIWAIVIYQFFSFSSSNVEQIATTTEYDLKPILIKERDTFSIDVNYRDPFLGKMYAPHTAKPKVKRIKPMAIVKIEPPVIWPTIIYKGIVSDNKEKIKIFMLIIGGKTCLMHIGSVENEVALTDGDRESVYVKYRGKLNLILQQE